MKCDELEQVENPIEWGLYYDKNEVDAAITELKDRIHELESIPHTDNSAVIERISNENERLKAKLESVQATAYTESVDAGMRERKLKRALCLAMAQVLEHVCPMTNRKAKWRDKWHKRWLAIAEKFKPNSTKDEVK